MFLAISASSECKNITTGGGYWQKLKSADTEDRQAGGQNV